MENEKAYIDTEAVRLRVTELRKIISEINKKIKEIYSLRQELALTQEDRVILQQEEDTALSCVQAADRQAQAVEYICNVYRECDENVKAVMLQTLHGM